MIPYIHAWACRPRSCTKHVTWPRLASLASRSACSYAITFLCPNLPHRVTLQQQDRSHEQRHDQHTRLLHVGCKPHLFDPCPPELRWRKALGSTKKLHLSTQVNGTMATTVVKYHNVWFSLMQLFLREVQRPHDCTEYSP